MFNYILRPLSGKGLTCNDFHFSSRRIITPCYRDYNALKVQLSAIRIKVPQKANTLCPFETKDVDFAPPVPSDEEKQDDSRGENTPDYRFCI